MTLSEDQVQRYARQILLTPVGGRGQLRLLSTGARLVGAGSALQVAAAYLAGGGTPLSLPERAAREDEVGFLLEAGATGCPLESTLGEALRDLNPDSAARPPRWGAIGALPAVFSGEPPWVALAGSRGRGALVHRSDAGCAGCFHRTVAALSPVPAPLGVLVGAAGALAFQRLVLALPGTPPLEALWVEPSGAFAPAEVLRCPEHGGTG